MLVCELLGVAASGLAVSISVKFVSADLSVSVQSTLGQVGHGECEGPGWV